MRPDGPSIATLLPEYVTVASTRRKSNVIVSLPVTRVDRLEAGRCGEAVVVDQVAEDDRHRAVREPQGFERAERIGAVGAAGAQIDDAHVGAGQEDEAIVGGIARIGRGVGAGTARQHVISAIALEGVRVAVADQGVGERRSVGALDAAECVGSAVSVAASGRDVDDDRAGGRGIIGGVVAGSAVERIVAAAAGDQVVAAAAEEVFPGGAAEQRVAVALADQADAARRERPVADIRGAADARIGIAGIDRDLMLPAATMLARAMRGRNRLRRRETRCRRSSCTDPTAREDRQSRRRSPPSRRP